MLKQIWENVVFIVNGVNGSALKLPRITSDHPANCPPNPTNHCLLSPVKFLCNLQDTLTICWICWVPSHDFLEPIIGNLKG